jgi:hypothetical protein
LIPEFPILAYYASYGIVASIAGLWARKQRWVAVAAAAVLFLTLQGMVLRISNTIPRVLAEPEARFGAMSQAQRASFETIEIVTPENALVGGSLNSGAIELYSGRNAFRPADWTTGELREFLDIARQNGYQVYLLQDDASLDRVLNDLGSTFRVERAAVLDVPLFGERQVPNAGTLWKVSGNGD